MGDKETMVIEEDVQWSRVGYLQLVGDKVVFDTSCGEYGPLIFDLQILIDAIKTHTDESDILRK